MASRIQYVEYNTYIKNRTSANIGQVDLTMMASLGGVERTEKEFGALLDAAGLEMLEVRSYDAKMQSVIMAAPKQR